MAHGLDKSFKSTSRVLFSEEIGDLSDFESFLSRYSEPLKKSKSIASKKDIFYSQQYSKKARFVSFEEVASIKPPQFNINDIKDMDSLLRAASENFTYSGNKVLGTSHDVQESENCIDSSFIYRSHEIISSEHVAYSQMVMNSKYMFGCSWGAENNFCVNVTEMSKAFRAFESAYALFCSDIYFCYNCKQCIDAMFSFNQYSKRHCIGNNVLEKSKFSSLKSKLVAEIAEGLKKNKTFPSLVEISSGGAK